MRFIINRSKLKELAKFRGWHALYTPLAEATGFSVSYCRRVVLGKEKLTDLFMLQYIKAAGMNPGRSSEWAALFDVDIGGGLPTKHSMAWNTHKLNAQGIPYRVFSESHEFRKKDNPLIEVEPFESLFDPETLHDGISSIPTK